jgi:spoIIIJ-associated protein
MSDLELSGKTVEEAIKKALSQLNVSADQVKIDVLSEGKSGILGLGAEEARIRVTLKQEAVAEDTDIIAIKNIVDQLLNKMGVSASVNTGPSENVVAEESAVSPIVLNIVGDDLGILIGRRGQTLDALQFLVRLLASRQTTVKRPIMVDVENYKQRRYDDLRTLALIVASQVKSKKSSLRLEPMAAFERRIIHLTLANDPEVTTESIGEGEARKVVIMPKNKK